MSVLERIRSVKKTTPLETSMTEFFPERNFPLPGGLSPASPCSACGCPIAWLDRYGGGPHCEACVPPPSRSLVDRRLYVLVVSGTVGPDGRASAGAMLAWIDWRDTPAYRREEE